MRKYLLSTFLCLLLVSGVSYGAWDKDKPAGNQKLRLADDDIRANNDAIDVVIGDMLDDGTAITATATEINTVADGITATAAEINTIADGATATAAEINTVADGSTAKNSHTHALSTGATDVTATAAEINTACDGITATAAELNQLDGKTAVNTTDAATIAGVVTLSANPILSNANPQLSADSTAKVFSIEAGNDSNRINLYGSTYAATPNQVTMDVGATTRFKLDTTGVAVTGAATVSSTLGVTGAVDFDSTADIASTLDIGSGTTRRVAPSGTFVDNIDGNPNLSDTTFNVVGAPVGAAWETVGPTGGGATNTWSALDGVPPDVDWIEVDIYNLGNRTAGSYDGFYATLYAKKEGSPEVVSNVLNAVSMIRGYGDATYPSSDVSKVTRKIPVDSRQFELYLDEDNCDSHSLYLVLVGWGVNP